MKISPLEKPLPPGQSTTHHSPPSLSEDTRYKLQEDVWQEIQGRILFVNRASLQLDHDDTQLNHRLGMIVRQASLFFGYHIPSWPPHLLVRKLVRKLVVPLLMPQADFNEATRDVLLMLRERFQTYSAMLTTSETTINEMNHQIDELRRQMAALQAQVENLSADSVATRKDSSL